MARDVDRAQLAIDGCRDAVERCIVESDPQREVVSAGHRRANDAVRRAELDLAAGRRCMAVGRQGGGEGDRWRLVRRIRGIGCYFQCVDREGGGTRDPISGGPRNHVDDDPSNGL